MTKQQQLELIQQNERLTKAVNDRAKTIKKLRKQINEQKELLAGLNRAADALMAALACTYGEEKPDGSYELRFSRTILTECAGWETASLPDEDGIVHTIARRKKEAKDETAREIVTRAWRTEVPDGIN